MFAFALTYKPRLKPHTEKRCPTARTNPVHWLLSAKADVVSQNGVSTPVLFILLTVFCLAGRPAFALPEYAKREQKACNYCHVNGAPGSKNPTTGEKYPTTCNQRGEYYGAHNHSLAGYKEFVPVPVVNATLAFKFVWKEEFTDLPRRIGVGDVTGDKTPRLVTLNEKLDNKNASVLIVRKWDGEKFVKEFEAETQSPPTKLQVGKFAGASKPAVILTADALWTYNGKTYERKAAAKPMNLFGNTRLKTGEERVLIANSPTDIKAYRINTAATGDFLTDGIESPDSRTVSWGDMHSTPAFFNEMGFPELFGQGGLLGLWDIQKNGKIALYYDKIDVDVDVQQGRPKPEFKIKKQTHYLVLSDPNVKSGAELWASPPLPAPLLDVRIEDARGSATVGILMLLGEPGQDKKRLLAFIAFDR